MAFRFPKLSFRSRRPSQRTKSEPLFDQLESRLALYADPFLANLPSLQTMLNTGNSIVRLLTAQGAIDIEIYDKGGNGGSTVPRVTAANFLNYVNTGRYDNTFFHRMIAGFVLQGGGYFDDPTQTPQYQTVTPDGPIVNEFDTHRSNLERTIAMAKLGDNPNSATNQWFFNLSDNNASNLDNQNGGFTVFGRVIQGWNVVTTIAGFQIRDLNTFLGGDAFGQVPLSGPNNTDLIRIIDAEVIKNKDQAAFMSNAVYFPDGFRSGRIVSTVELQNDDPNTTAQYQIIARYETNTRDTVIASGTLAAGAHLSVPISKAGTPTLDLVKATAPFAYLIRSTKPVSAALNHTDFGATASEGFFQANQFSASQIESWTFANGQKGAGIASYIVWENLSEVANTVTLTFYPEGGSPLVMAKTTQPYRRGGLDIQQLTAVPDGPFSVVITSTQPIVAALSQYRAAPARASMELGVIAGGNTEGILPGAYIASVGQSTLTVLYTQASPTIVTIDFEFILTDGSILTTNAAFTVSSTVRIRTADISTLNAAIPVNENFTIRYKVRNAAAPVVVSYFSITTGDAMTTPFQTVSSKELVFGDGFTDPTSGATDREVLSIFNPYADNTTTVTYRIKFHFADSTSDEIIVPASGSGTIQGSHLINISTRSLTDVMARITSDAKFRHYSISVSADFNRGGNTVEGAVFAQLTRTGAEPNESALTTGPTLSPTATIFFADNVQFGAP